MKTKTFTPTYIPTVGTEVHPFESFEIVDTPGQAKFVGDAPSRLLDPWQPDAVLLLVSVDSKQSYRNLAYWYDWVPEGIPVVIVGTKCDIDARRMTRENTTFHRDNRLAYFDISVKSGFGLESLGDYLDTLLAETKGKDVSYTGQSLVA